MESVIIGRNNQKDYLYLNLDVPNSKLTHLKYSHERNEGGAQCWAGWLTLVRL